MTGREFQWIKASYQAALRDLQNAVRAHEMIGSAYRDGMQPGSVKPCRHHHETSTGGRHDSQEQEGILLVVEGLVRTIIGQVREFVSFCISQRIFGPRLNVEPDHDDHEARRIAHRYTERTFV